ncbi:MAG: formylglycine-generating enzyme family protein [Nitrospirae bacterium]|nr:formylglycine-generating enzyme family protein [Nitrospirota bacterium]
MKHNKVKNQGLTLFLILISILFSSVSFADPAPSNIPGMDGMVIVKAGCFDMGDVIGDGDPDEKPVHKVCLDDFYIGKYEVTQKQWKAVMGNYPSSHAYCEDCPVENVSYLDVQEFIRKLNRMTEGKYRLPTEAEWEYAARSAGKKEDWAGLNNEKGLDAYAWFKNNAGIKTHPVGQKKPNGLGLYDISGNVQEWVNDFHESEFYSTRPKKTAEKNPAGPEWSQYRVVRGGSMLNSSWGIRNAVRYRFTADDRGREFGFRLAVSPK